MKATRHMTSVVPKGGQAREQLSVLFVLRNRYQLDFVLNKCTLIQRPLCLPRPETLPRTGGGEMLVPLTRSHEIALRQETSVA
jgi:hypothetical protein